MKSLHLKQCNQNVVWQNKAHTQLVRAYKTNDDSVEAIILIKIKLL